MNDELNPLGVPWTAMPTQMVTSAGTYTAFSAEAVREAILHPKPRPTGDLRVTWSCANCGRELRVDLVKREEWYYEFEVYDDLSCPVCDAAYYLEKG